ncbi:MAG: cytochrome P450, partial [Thermoanaerobaculia bacterium]|nr:cytochrome P450 [Thermoanaerobaculia bacterium]
MSRRSTFPLGAQVRLADLEVDPYPIFRRLREREPVTWLTEIEMWLVTRYDDAVAVLRDPATYTTES